MNGCNLRGAVQRVKLNKSMPEQQHKDNGKRILLADDEPEIREVVQEMLGIDGHEVTVANNGAEALQLFRKGSFDLVVTDYEMPVMKGNELAIHIKAVAPNLPVLMITSYDRDISPAENPVDAILDKPFTLDNLRAAISRLLSRTHNTAPLDSAER